MTKRCSLSRFSTYAVGYVLAALWIVPLLWMTLVALKPYTTAINDILPLLKPPFTLDNFRRVLAESSILTWMLNSIVVSGVITVLTIVLTSMAAYALSALPFKGSGWVYWLIIAGMMIPIEAMVVPLYMTMDDLDLIDTRAALILPGIAAPLGVIILKQFFDAVPKDLINAAVMDGAGPWRIYWHIFVPLSKSSMAALGIFTFLNSWNSFLWPYLSINSEEVMTIPIGVPLFQGGFSTEMTRPMAANVIASVPVLLAFVLFQRHIVKGVAMTGIK